MVFHRLNSILHNSGEENEYKFITMGNTSEFYTRTYYRNDHFSKGGI
jgi:hypothetical protein